MTSQLPICVTCGTQYATARPDCPICEDERQYVPAQGQQWTTLATLRSGGHAARVEEQAPGIWGVGSTPSFGIGQRALLVPTTSGNILWDCVTYLDEDLVEQVGQLGGITAIAISHPHYYTTMVEWAQTFDVPVYLHESDQEWIGRSDSRLTLWSGHTLPLAEDVTLVNLGVHFPGGTVLHWSAGAADRGALFSGDIVQVNPDLLSVSFMYSYPNHIPERPSVVRQAAARLEPFPFDHVYGAWWGRVILGNGKQVVQRSVERYLASVRD